MFFRLRKPNTDKANETKTLHSTFVSGRYYAEQWQNIISSEQEPHLSQLERYRTELWFFIYSLNNKWMGNRFERLSKPNQIKLEELLKLTSDIYDEVDDCITHMKKDLVLQNEIENLATPEATSTRRGRRYTNWNKAPLRFSEETIQHGSTLPIPN